MFEESNSLVKNVVKIDSLGENFEKIFMIDLPAQEEDDKKKDDTNGEYRNIEVEPTQPLSLEICYKSFQGRHHRYVSKRVTTCSKLHGLCDHFAFISHIELKNILEAEGDSYWFLAMQEELNQFERN